MLEISDIYKWKIPKDQDWRISVLEYFLAKYALNGETYGIWFQYLAKKHKKDVPYIFVRWESFKRQYNRNNKVLKSKPDWHKMNYEFEQSFKFKCQFCKELFFKNEIKKHRKENHKIRRYLKRIFG